MTYDALLEEAKRHLAQAESEVATHAQRAMRLRRAIAELDGCSLPSTPPLVEPWPSRPIPRLARTASPRLADELQRDGDRWLMR